MAPELAWVRLTGNDGWASAPLALGTTGNLLLAGGFQDEVTLAEGEADAITLSNGLQTQDFYVATMRSDGSPVWARAVGGEVSDHAAAVAPAADGGLWVSGRVGPGAVFGPGEGGETALEHGLYLARYESDGSLAWAGNTATGGTSPNNDVSLAALPDGGVLLTGQFGTAATFGAGELDETTLLGDGMFLARFGPDGRLVWAQGAEGDPRPLAIDVLPDGSPVVAGRYCRSVSFPSGEGAIVLDGGGGCGPEDIFEPCLFVARYATDGSVDWARAACSESGGWATALALAVVEDQIAIAGGLEGRVTFWSDDDEQTIDVPRRGYLAMLHSDGRLEWITTIEGAAPVSLVAAGDGILMAGHFGWWGEPAVFGPDVVLDDSGLFLARYATCGGVEWVKALRGDPAFGPGTNAFYWAHLTRSPESSIFLTTTFVGSVTVGEGDPNEVELWSELSRSLVARFDP